MSAEGPESKKILLVCSRGCTRVEHYLVHAGYRVTKVDEGRAAIARAKHEPVNAAVLVSTGMEMDLAETALNLKDISPCVPIIIVAGSSNAEEKAVQAAAIVRALPEITVVTAGELEHHLTSLR